MIISRIFRHTCSVSCFPRRLRCALPLGISSDPFADLYYDILTYWTWILFSECLWSLRQLFVLCLLWKIIQIKYIYKKKKRRLCEEMKRLHVAKEHIDWLKEKRRSIFVEQDCSCFGFEPQTDSQTLKTWYVHVSLTTCWAYLSYSSLSTLTNVEVMLPYAEEEREYDP